ncbi:MAG: alpha-glucan family phosphorylase [Chloroflexi bacterium]|nr:alpha-glucan family phosphorylase [Chloroflexota bacterium]
MKENHELPVKSASIAYFSMEVGLDPAMPTYAGGLGVLAGDTLRAAADLGIPMVGVTLIHRRGYFRQHIDRSGNQTETPAIWSPQEFMDQLPNKAHVNIDGRKVAIAAWRYRLRGISGQVVPIYFLDTNLPENSAWDRQITDSLYAGDDHLRLCQELVLGIGGVNMLRAAGHRAIGTFHMNEGHSALLVLALLEERTEGRGIRAATMPDREAVRQRCVFTTHTPVPAAHDHFPLDMVRRTLGEERTLALLESNCCPASTLDPTYLALFFSRFINGVAMSHGEISRTMYPAYPVNSVTNGVHGVAWTVEPFRRLYDSHIPEWRKDNIYLRYVISIPLEEIRKAHLQAKQQLLGEIERRSGEKLDPAAMTLGFARRATAYKRADLLFYDIDRLRHVARTRGPLQIVYGGKAHPQDEGGKKLIRRIFEVAAQLKGDLRIVYLEEYDLNLAKLLCGGVDLWLNTPEKPREASGTSGMKAALNGVPSFSVLDGWWVEGHTEGITGWSIGDKEIESDARKESSSLYDKLETVILPMFYDRPLDYATVMSKAIALNASFFNAQRMVFQYLRNAYLIGEGPYSVGTLSL